MNEIMVTILHSSNDIEVAYNSNDTESILLSVIKTEGYSYTVYQNVYVISGYNS